MNYPLISLICPTKGDFQLPYKCARDQTYPNLELIFVHELENDVPGGWESDVWDRVRRVYVPPLPKTSLGELYNIGVEHAKGELCAVWDSDDWHGPERIMNQYNVFERTGKPTMLGQWGIWDRVNEKAYLSYVRPWEGSLLCPRELLLKHRYTDKYKGCDTALVQKLVNDSGIVCDGDWQDMIYVAHYNNTCGRAHMETLMRRSMRLGKGAEDTFRSRVNGH